jgi:hypothetical protein
MTKQQITELVARHLAGPRFADVQVQIEDEGVRQEDSWWFVPIRPLQHFVRSDQFYAILADLEEEIDQETGLNILLVPAV